MRTQRRWSLAAVAAVAMLASLVGVPLAAGRPDGEAEVPAADPADNAVDVEGTVAEVQRRLREDPRLPRLTPDQIRGLIREVAANDSRLHLAEDEDTTATSNSSERGDRSLVLVMSHSAANMSGERLQSLYTQPPVTRVVPDHLLHHHQQQPGAHDHQQHHDQAPAPPRPAEDAERATPGPARTPPPTAVPPNHRPSYDDPEPHWRQRQPPATQPFRPLDPGLLASLSLSPRPPTTAAPTTTTAAPTTPAAHAESPDVSAAAAALSPAVRDLLQSLGLLDPVPPPQPPSAALAPAGPPPPDPAPFRAFKPLPQSRAEPQEQDMRSLLHRYGLLDPAPPTRGRRRQKTLAGAPPSDANGTEMAGDGSSTTTTSTTPLTLDAIDTSMLTDEMRAVLQNLGIVPAPTADAAPTSTRDPVHEPTTDGGASDTDVDDATAKQGPEHVFSPTSLKHSEEETARLQAVLDSVRQFAATHLNATPAANGSGPAQSTTARPDRALEVTTTAKPLAAGPDPVSFEELLAGLHTEESRKNEVKRQQPSDANTTATTGSPEREVEEVTSRANRTAEDEARVQALSESFGGLDDSGDADYEEQEGGEQAVQRPNGLYFLVDWNSFLRVGEEDKPRVNLRFSPRAGNPRNFLPVTVP